MSIVSDTSRIEEQEFFPFNFNIRSPFEPPSQQHKMDGHDRKNSLIETSPYCANREFSEKDIEYDDHPSSIPASDASHGHDDSYDKYKHDYHPDSSPAENASHVNTSIRKRRKSECYDLTTEHCEEYRPSKKFKQHGPHFRNKKRNKNIFTNERNLRSERVEQDDDFFSTKPSTVTNRRAERDEKPFDICNTPNVFAPRELSSPPQSNEIYKEIQNLMPGMFLLKKWLTKLEQYALVEKCQELGLGNGGFFQPSFDDGKKMCLRMMCLGVNWNHKTYRYEELRAHDNAQPPSIPSNFVPLVHRAIEDSRDKLRMDHNITQEESLKALPGLDPDVCIVNFYEKSGRLGLHQDKDESRASLEKGLPVVSFSIGDTAEFCYGKERKFAKLNKIKLESGDVLIFGGESRLVFHSVSGLYSGTAPHWLTENNLLRPGRLNLTFRQRSI